MVGVIALSVVGRCWCGVIASSVVVGVIASSVVGRCWCDCLDCGRSLLV